MHKIVKMVKVTFHESNQGLPGILLGAIAILVAVAVAFAALAPLVLAAAALAGLVILGRSSWEHRERLDAMAANYAWQAYARTADTPEEARARMAAGMAAGAGVFPPVNIDGMPMLDGTGTDIFGRVYGDGNDDAYNFEAFAPDVGTGMPLDIGDAYHEPLGMHSSH